jgi:hypothetical protein
VLLNVTRTSEVIVKIKRGLLAKEGWVDANGRRRRRANVVEGDFEAVEALLVRVIHALKT